MIAQLKRNDYGPDGILSKLTLSTGQSWFTGSHAYKTLSGSYLPKLSSGTYTVKRYFSPDNGYELFWITGVPDFMGMPVTMLEIHVGNKPQIDSKGCELIGKEIWNDKYLFESKKAFDELMAALEGLDSFTLEVIA